MKKDLLLENSTEELLKDCKMIVAESTRKKRHLHPLFKENSEKIHNIFDSMFPLRKKLSVARKMTGLILELETSKKYLEDGGLTCPICGIYTRHDVRQHIRTMHPEAKEMDIDLPTVSKKVREKYSENFRGSKNPAYQHGGKLSPFSKKFIYYSEEKRLKTVKKAHAHENYTTRLDYWLKKGLTQSEAEDALSDRQDTFSLTRCIERHGKKDGEKIWKDRQIRWQKTMNSKSTREIEKIRQGKSTGRMCQLFNQNPKIKEVPGILYLVEFSNSKTKKSFYKVGITSKKSVKARFGRAPLKLGWNISEIFLHSDSFYNCFKIEQAILRHNKEIRIIVEDQAVQTTEAFRSLPDYQTPLKESLLKLTK